MTDSRDLLARTAELSADYLDSLDTLDAACAADGVEFILPAHGHVLGAARDAIAGLRMHRLRREARVLAAMRARPDGTPEDWLPVAYADVDDLDAARATLLSAGATERSAPRQVAPEARVCVLADGDGNPIGLRGK